MHHLARQFDQEIAKAREALSLDPDFLMAHYRLGEGLLAQGKAVEAIAPFEKALAVSGHASDLIATTAYAYARAGRQSDARTALATLMTRHQSGQYVSSFAIALIHTGLGDREQALSWLKRAHDERAWGVAFLGVEVAFDSLRNEPRFQALLMK